VERSSLEELSERPLADRIKEFDLLLEAAGDTGLLEPRVRSNGLDAELESRLVAHERTGDPFALALLMGGEGWPGALADAAGPGETVLDAGSGATAVIIAGVPSFEAQAAVDRLRVCAWRGLGGGGRLADVGVASCPDDATGADRLLATARERLGRATAGQPVVSAGADVTPLYPPAF